MLQLDLASSRVRESKSELGSSKETPTDIPRVHAGGPNPDRILLFGIDIIVGRGVLSHEASAAPRSNRES